MKRMPLFGLKEVIREATHRLHSSSFWGLPYRILTMNPKKELLWSLKGIRAYSGASGSYSYAQAGRWSTEYIGPKALEWGLGVSCLKKL